MKISDLLIKDRIKLDIQSTNKVDVIKELAKLHEEFGRYEKRWKALEKDIDKITRDVKDITTTSNKISKRFIAISNVNMSEQIENRKTEIMDIEEQSDDE